MAFKTREGEETGRPAPAKQSAALKPSAPSTKPAAVAAHRPMVLTDRLGSLDAYRGLTMLFLVSGGLAINRIVAKHPALLQKFDGSSLGRVWRGGWQIAAAQLEHSEWTGCSAWDLIQPSFMFMVGVAMPFSYAARAARGDTWGRQFFHAVLRGLILVLLGIFLRSSHSPMTNFTFEDVLTQIGLGYAIVFLLVNRPAWMQFTAVLAILGGYWFLFYHYPLPPPEGDLVTRYLTQVRHQPAAEWNQFSGLAAHWNKHTNAAAGFDRIFLNLFPRAGVPWEGKKFWINGGGYQTLNFVPSMVTMLFGVMAGQLLRGPRTPRDKFWILFSAGAACFVVSMGIDTTIWPFSFRNLNYSFAPVVKRIWSPSWAVFSAGWTFWFLALFYWVVDIRGHRRLVFPLTVLGMNSIAVYCMDHLIDGWLISSSKIHLATVDAAAHTSLVKKLYETDNIYGAVWHRLVVIALIWLICLWMYRRRIFVRI